MRCKVVLGKPDRLVWAKVWAKVLGTGDRDRHASSAGPRPGTTRRLGDAGAVTLDHAELFQSLGDPLRRSGESPLRGICL